MIQKQILIEFCDLNLSLRVRASIDLEDKDTKESYELKSTTSYDGAETISQIQAQNADFLIWMFVDFSRYQIEVRILDLRDPKTRQEAITCSSKQSFAIKKLFDKKKLKDEFTLKMSNLKIIRKNV